MFKLLTLPTAITLSFASNVIAASKCTANAPCSREGWCDSGPMFCMYSLCNPSKPFNSTSCWKPDGCASADTQFDKSSEIVPIKKYDGSPYTNPFVSIFEPNNALIEDGKLVLKMARPEGKKKQGVSATVKPSSTIKYGRVSARIKTASVATGVVTAFIIRNGAIGDEIDFEWVGKDPKKVLVNCFYRFKGVYSNTIPVDMDDDNSKNYHDYTIEWTEDIIKWFVDGKLVHTLERNTTYDKDLKPYKFPIAESQVGISIWDSGHAPREGTRRWAGSPTLWSKGTVYKAYFDSIRIECSGKHIAPSPPAPDSNSSLLISTSLSTPAPSGDTPATPSTTSSSSSKGKSPVPSPIPPPTTSSGGSDSPANPSPPNQIPARSHNQQIPIHHQANVTLCISLSLYKQICLHLEPCLVQFFSPHLQRMFILQHLKIAKKEFF